MEYLRAGRVDDAVRRFEEAVALRPNHPVTNTLLGVAYLQSGRNEDAYRSFLLVERLHPDSWRALLGLAVLHAGSDDPETAQRHLTRALEVGGEEARAEAARYPVLAPLLPTVSG